MIFNFNTCVNGNIVLDFYSGANGYIISYKNILSNIAIFTQFGFGHNVSKMPNSTALANSSTVIHHRRRVNRYRRMDV